MFKNIFLVKVMNYLFLAKMHLFTGRKRNIKVKNINNIFFVIFMHYTYVTVVNGCYDYGFISAKTNSPYFGIESDMVC